MKRKGFTLIELLGVIVVLAVIAIITTPVILGVIEKSKRGALQSSGYGLVESGILYHAEYQNSQTVRFDIKNNQIRTKEENKIEILDDKSAMWFNTGLLTEHGADIYAYFVNNTNNNKKEGQDWFLYGFKQRSDLEMRAFRDYPDIADYFTTPSDFIYDKSMKLSIDYDHIIDDNYERFVQVGLTDKYMINGLLLNAVQRIVEKVKRNYKLAIPQYYTDKTTHESKIQLLLPLFLQSKDVADLALVVDKGPYAYVGKTILTLEWAYVNSRRIVRPDVEWLKIWYKSIDI